jgi:hypothetical protein
MASPWNTKSAKTRKLNSTERPTMKAPEGSDKGAVTAGITTAPVSSGVMTANQRFNPVALSSVRLVRLATVIS